MARAQACPGAGLVRLLGVRARRTGGRWGGYDSRMSAFRGASFTGADFTGANFRDCDLRQVKITDSWLVDVSLSGLVGNLVVNDVDVTAFLEGELDRRYPQRVQLREKRSADDYRALRDTIDRLAVQTV